jgi:hypothetical protein
MVDSSVYSSLANIAITNKMLFYNYKHHKSIHYALIYIITIEYG